MKKILGFALISIALILSACAPSSGGNNDNNMPMGDNPMMTATPGSMMPSNPDMGHSMEPITAPNVQPATQTTGGQPLAYREENGVKVFELTTKAVQWPILDGVTVTAFTYNGTVPGPMIRVTEGDQVRIVVRNELPDPPRSTGTGSKSPTPWTACRASPRIRSSRGRHSPMNLPPGRPAHSCITRISKAIFKSQQVCMRRSSSTR